MGDLTFDRARAARLADRLYRLFSVDQVGLFGHTAMPEDELPRGVSRGSLEHILFVTLTVAIDYQRDAPELWRVSRAAFADPATRYLFDPAAIHAAGFGTVARDLAACRLARKPRQDARTWQTVAVTFLKKWGADPRRFLDDSNRHGPTVLQRLAGDRHPERDCPVPDFPFLRGPKIGPLWLRMLRDNVGLQLEGLDEVPIPVDVHVARATFTTGVLRGTCSVRLQDVFPQIRAAWFEGARAAGAVDGRPLVALDVDEPLWHLSKYGCSARAADGSCTQRLRCPAGDECVNGRVRLDARGWLDLDT